MSKNTPCVIASGNRLSKLFLFSERKCINFFKAAKWKPGKYDLEECIRIYVEANDGKDESTLLKKAERELKEHKLKEKQGLFHHRDDIVMIVSDMLVRFRGKINSIPTKLAIELMNKENSREIESILKKELDSALEELSEYQFLEEKIEKNKKNRSKND